MEPLRHVIIMISPTWQDSDKIFLVASSLLATDNGIPSTPTNCSPSHGSGSEMTPDRTSFPKVTTNEGNSCTSINNNKAAERLLTLQVSYNKLPGELSFRVWTDQEFLVVILGMNDLCDLAPNSSNIVSLAHPFEMSLPSLSANSGHQFDYKVLSNLVIISWNNSLLVLLPQHEVSPHI